MAQPGTPGLLILCRHGQSIGNLENIFTGWRDLPLTERGEEEARRAGRMLRAERLGVRHAFTSALIRARESCELMLEASGIDGVITAASVALNERDYGDLTGMNKDQARTQWGDEQVHRWRRSYDEAPPHGESLRDTGARVLPYYIHTILPAVWRKAH